MNWIIVVFLKITLVNLPLAAVISLLCFFNRIVNCFTIETLPWFFKIKYIPHFREGTYFCMVSVNCRDCSKSVVSLIPYKPLQTLQKAIESLLPLSLREVITVDLGPRYWLSAALKYPGSEWPNEILNVQYCCRSALKENCEGDNCDSHLGHVYLMEILLQLGNWSFVPIIKKQLF